MVLVVLCLFWTGVTTDIPFHTDGKLLDLANLPLAVGIFSFCWGGHSVFPSIYSSMEDPSRFPSVLVARLLL